MRTTIGGLIFAFLICCADAADFSQFKREIPKLPALMASQPLYGVFVFGAEREKYVWAILEKSSDKSSAFDVLLIDLNADGDLTQSTERFAGKVGNPESKAAIQCVFQIGRFADPALGRPHTDFTITWRPHRVSYRMNWLGGKPTIGTFGPEPDQYGNFSTSVQEVPLIVPGHERPFQFEHWMSGKLMRGADNDFKVFLGNKGSGLGMFSSVDDKFLPPGDYVIAKLIYKDQFGKEQQSHFDLKSRC
jgi:hypothetical protein